MGSKWGVREIVEREKESRAESVQESVQERECTREIPREIPRLEITFSETKVVASKLNRLSLAAEYSLKSEYP